MNLPATPSASVWELTFIMRCVHALDGACRAVRHMVRVRRVLLLLEVLPQRRCVQHQLRGQTAPQVLAGMQAAMVLMNTSAGGGDEVANVLLGVVDVCSRGAFAFQLVDGFGLSCRTRL